MGKSSLSVGTQGWSARINEAYRHSAESVLEVGRLLLECKKTVQHGDFQHMIEHDLHFEVRTAQRLMAIAKDRRFSNATNLSFLPRAVSSLFEMTKLDDDAFETALATGEISPKATRKEVAKLRAPKVIDVDHEDITPKSGEQLSRSNEAESRRNPSISGEQQQSADEADTPAVATEGLPGSAVPESDVCSSLPYAADDREIRDSGHQLEVAAGVLSMLDREASVFDIEPNSPSTVAVEMSSAERLKRLLVELHRFVEDECNTEQMAREYDGDFTPGKIAAGLNWLDDFYTEFVKIEEGRAAAE